MKPNLAHGPMMPMLVPGLQGQDEIIFQFCKSKGWPHAQHVGTVTPYQAWLALKKLGREDYDVTKVLLQILQSASSLASHPVRMRECAMFIPMSRCEPTGKQQLQGCWSFPACAMHMQLEGLQCCSACEGRLALLPHLSWSMHAGQG